MSRTACVLVVGVTVLGACAQPPAPAEPAAPEVAYLLADPASTLPFSDAVRVGHLLFLSGQIGTDSTGAVVAGGIEAETRQTLENIKAVLERNGSSMDKVIKCTAMLVDMSEWGTMNGIYVTYFPVHKPARSAFGASGLALGARLELECWATVGTD